MVVEDRHVAHAQPGLRTVEIDFNSIVIYGNHPEHVIVIDVNVVVVNLLREAGRSNRTGVQVKSNESEGAAMLASVSSDELALTESHIGLVCERRGCAGHRVDAGSSSSNVGKSDEAVEICDL